MGKAIKRYVWAAIVIAILVLIVAIAIGVWSYIENDDEEGASEAIGQEMTASIPTALPRVASSSVGWPPHPPTRMDLSGQGALLYLRDRVGFGAVIEAIAEGDVEALLALSQKATHYCSSFRGMIPPGCADYTSYLPTVREYGGVDFRLRLPEDMRQRLTSLLALQPVALEFASRLTSPPEGKGDQYWLLFRMNGEVVLDGNHSVSALGLILEPGRPDPIERFAFFDRQGDGLLWLVATGMSYLHTEIWSSYN